LLVSIKKLKEVITFVLIKSNGDEKSSPFKFTNTENMKIAAANKKLDSIIEKVEKEGILAKGLVDDLKELREFALKEQDPLVTKVLRLTYEFLTEREAFDVQAQYEEDEEENEYPIEIEDLDNLLYLLNLLKNADHKINREEIKDYRTALKEELY
jgi:hypothetical protein